MQLLRRLLLWPLTVVLNLLVHGIEGKEKSRAAPNLGHAEILARLRAELKAAPFQGFRLVACAYGYAQWLHRHQLYEEAHDVWQLALFYAGMSLRERIECHLELASCLIGLDRYEEAEAKALQPLERWLGAAGEHWPAREFSVKIAEFRRDFGTETRLRLGTFRANPALKPDFERRLLLALAYWGLGRRTRALQHFRRARALAQTPYQEVRACVMEANLLSSLGEFALAEERHRQGFKAAGNEPNAAIRAYSTWASFLEAQGRFSDCETVLRRLNNYPLEHHLYLSFLTGYHLTFGRHALARQTLAKLRLQGPPAPHVRRHHLILCDWQTINIELNAFSSGLDADLALVRRKLDGIRRARPQTRFELLGIIATDAALSAIEGNREGALLQLQALELCYRESGSDPIMLGAYADNMARTYFHLEEYEAALPWAETSLDNCIYPLHRVLAQSRLAGLHEALGNDKAAQELWQTVVTSEYPIPAVKMARAKLGYSIL